MLFELNSDISINGIHFKGVNKVHIKRSVHTLSATATIKVPVTAVLKAKGEQPAEVETAKQFNEGDPVTIMLGYNGEMRTEFVGYIKQKNYTQPLEIVCEDAYYQTRSKTVTLSGSATLADTLKACGLTVTYAVPLQLRNFVADKKTVAWVLGKLKTEYGLHVFFDMDGGVIAGRAFDVTSGTVKYRLRHNVIKDDDLQYRLAADRKLKVKAICYQKNGIKVEGEIGTEGGATKTLYFYDVEDVAELKSLAEAELMRHSYDGYDGKIVTFLQPYAEPCMIAEIEDPVYNERDGSYYIEEVEVTYGTSGARRIVTIGLKQ